MLKQIILAIMLCIFLFSKMVFAMTGLKIDNKTDSELALYILATGRCESKLFVPSHGSRTITREEFDSICPTMGFCLFDIYLNLDCKGRRLAFAELEYLNPFHFTYFNLDDWNYSASRTELGGRPTLLEIQPVSF